MRVNTGEKDVTMQSTRAVYNKKNRAQDWKYLLLMDLKALQVLCRRRETVDAMRAYVEQNGIEVCF